MTPFPMGINLGGNVPYDTSMAWVDVSRYFRHWGPMPPPSPLGYPLAAARTQTQMQGYPAGVYKPRYRGKGVPIVLGRGAAMGQVLGGDDGINRADLTLAADHGLLTVMVNPDPADPITDLRIIAPGYDLESPPPFTWQFLRSLSLFRCIRTMCWSGANAGTIAEWADRVTPASACWTGPDQVPWEAHIALANATGKDLWITVPDQYSDDAVTQLATLAFATLDPGLNLYVEFSNEPWNKQFPQCDRLLAQADAILPPALTKMVDMAQVAYAYAVRALDVATAFRRAFGTQMGRVRPVVGGQSNSTSFAANVLKWLSGMGAAPSTAFHGLAIAPYVNLPLAADVPGLTLDGLFAAMQQNLAGPVAAGIQGHAALAKQYGLKLLAYEGGQGLKLRVGSPPTPTNEPVKLAAQTDPRMGDLYRGLFGVWAAAGGDLFAAFCGTSAWETAGGSDWWGLQPDQAVAATAKFSAVAEMAAAGT